MSQWATLKPNDAPRRSPKDRALGADVLYQHIDQCAVQRADCSLTKPHQDTHRTHVDTLTPPNIPTSPAMEPSHASGWGRNGTLADRAAMVTVAAEGATLHTRAPTKLVGRMAAADTNAMMVDVGEKRERQRGRRREGRGGSGCVGGREARRRRWW